MIYEFPDPGGALRQGDIFRDLPRAELSLSRISIINKEEEQEIATWEALRGQAEPITAIVGLRSVWAIVVTQDCDTARVADITLCEIRRLPEVVKLSGEPKSPKDWVDRLTRQAIMNLKWFYLPPDATIGFSQRMAVDFLATLRVQRVDLEDGRHLRVGRLNSTADEHFRERLAEFFRRYPYNEWYPLNKEEFEAYRSKYPAEADNITPYPYQT